MMPRNNSKFQSQVGFKHKKTAKKPTFTIYPLFWILLAGLGLLVIYRYRNLLLALESEDNYHFRQEIELQAKSICTDTSIQAMNQPGIRLETTDQAWMLNPLSCEHNSTSETCKSETRRLEEWRRSKNTDVKEIFEENERNFSFNARFTSLKFFQLANQLSLQIKTQTEQDAFDVVVKKIISMRYILPLAEMIDRIKIGDCREQTYYSLVKLLELPMTLKVQTVEVSYARLNVVHIYNLIDSNLPDIEIFENPDAVESYLANLKQGFICDNWNKGYFSDVNQNKMKMYKKGWTGLRVYTLDNNFDLSALPFNVSEILAREIETLRIPFKTKKAMLPFFDNKNANDDYDMSKTVYRRNP